MKKLIKYLISLILFIFAFINFGKYLDDTDTPQKSDIIICLGGGAKERTIKAIELYNNGFSNSKKLIFTGDNRTKKAKEDNKEDSRIIFLKENYINNIDYTLQRDIKNTKAEMLFIKNLMLEKNYKSAIIISDTPHSKRIKTLLSLIHTPNDANLTFNVVGTNASWWNSEEYYKNNQSLKYAISEAIKLSYAYVAYGIGLDEFFESLREPIIDPLEKKISEFLLLIH